MSEMLMRDHERLKRYLRVEPLSDSAGQHAGMTAYVATCPICNREVGAGIAASTATMQLWEHKCIQNTEALERHELYKEAAFKLAEHLTSAHTQYCHECALFREHAPDCTVARILRTDPERAKRMGLGWAL